MTTTINAKSTGIGGLDVTCDASGSLGLQTGGVTAVTINTSQNVGIGTTSPSGKFHVANANTAGTSADNLGVYFSSINRNCDVYIQAKNTEGSKLNFGDGDNASVGRISYEHSTNHMAFDINAAERMRIDSSGNVGIGTTSPSDTIGYGRALDIQSNTGAAVYLRDSDNPTTQYGFVSFDGNAAVNNFNVVNSSSTGPIRLITNNSERMRIDSSGRLMLGTTTTSISSLDAKYFDAADGQRLFSARGSTAAREHIIFLNPNGDVGSIDTSGTSTSYNTSSDYRLKENITPMVGALNTVAQLKPVTYTWKADGSEGQGFIAHELQAVVPDCVTGVKDEVETYTDEDGVEKTRPKYQGIDTSYLVATLTAAIQEQQTIINDLKARIETLESK